MEGNLEKFGNSEEWRMRLKKNLCIERPIDSTKLVTRVVENRMDLGDLQQILEEKRNLQATMQNEANCNPKEDTHSIKSELRMSKTNTMCVFDESFAALERMCDKTASDPNSTLFRYLHSGNMKRSEDVNETAEKKFVKETDAETEALNKLLNEFDLHKPQQEIIDLTQLDDVEAPSAFWERSAMESETLLQTSPVKMVGLLRPSTIIEEGDCLSISNVSVECTAECAAHSESDESSCYETAHDHTDIGDLKLQLPKQEQEPIDLDASTSDVLDSIFDANDSALDVDSPDIANDENDMNKSELELSVDSHASQSMKEHQEEGNVSDSPHFNDTIEEVEYMLKKGLEYIQSGAPKLNSDIAHKPLPQANCANVKASNTPEKYLNQKKPAAVKTPTTNHLTTNKTKKENTVPNESMHFEVKPMPKLNFFQKPSGIPTVSNLRRKPLHFNNIVSPIGTYMKNTGVTPFLVSTQAKTNADIHNSSAIRRLHDIEPQLKNKHIPTVNERVFSPRSLPKKAYISSELKQIVDERTPVKVPGGNSIQKYIGKAMVPNVLRHDGKLKIPDSTGNSKLKPPTQIMPHDAKLGGRKTDIQDLSIMSGNVSMYTIKNARKF